MSSPKALCPMVVWTEYWVFINSVRQCYIGGTCHFCTSGTIAEYRSLGARGRCPPSPWRSCTACTRIGRSGSTRPRGPIIGGEIHLEEVWEIIICFLRVDEGRGRSMCRAVCSQHGCWTICCYPNTTLLFPGPGLKIYACGSAGRCHGRCQIYWLSTLTVRVFYSLFCGKLLIFVTHECMCLHRAN